MLKENINQDVFVSMIRSKLPEDVLLQLKMLLNGAKSKWAVENLRAQLHENVTACKLAEKKDEATKRRHNGVIDNQITKNDELVKKHFKENLTFVDGHYKVTWPWKEENPELPVNRQLAVGRLRSNVSKVRNKPELLKLYDSIIRIS